MKLFDIVGGKVVVHADMYALPPLREYYESTKDKDQVQKVLSFIILCDYWNSPYVLTMDPTTREKKLKKDIFKDENYKLSVEEQICRDEYNKIIYTRNLKMLDAMRNKIETISNYYENSLEEELDEKKIQVLLAGMEKVKGTYQTMDYLEKAVKSEQLDNTRVRGDSKINPYEIA